MSSSKDVHTKILIDFEEYKRLQGLEEKFNKAQKQLEELVLVKKSLSRKLAESEKIAAEKVKEEESKKGKESSDKKEESDQKEEEKKEESEKKDETEEQFGTGSAIPMTESPEVSS